MPGAKVKHDGRRHTLHSSLPATRGSLRSSFKQPRRGSEVLSALFFGTSPVQDEAAPDPAEHSLGASFAPTSAPSLRRDDDAPDSALVAACKDPAVTLESLCAAVATGSTSADGFGLTALHWLCVNPSATPPMVQAVHELDRNAIRTEVARERLRLNDELLYRCWPGEVPLHFAVRNPKLCNGLLRTVLELNPSAATKINKEGHTPLHLFCMFNLNINAKTLRLVLELDPSAATKTSNPGSTPLHLFCGFNLNINAETLRLVLELDPSPAATQTTKDGITPLHKFCAANPNINAETLRLVLELEPSAATKTNNHGLSPLHIFCMFNPNINAETLRLVLELDPSAVTKTDVVGARPLAYLALDAGPTHVTVSGDTRHRDPAAVALALVGMGLETALAKAGNHAALHYACQGQSPERTNEIVGLMLRGGGQPGEQLHHAGALLPRLLGLPGRTLERVSACAHVTERVNDALLRPASVDALVADGSTRLLPLIGLYFRLSHAFVHGAPPPPPEATGLGDDGDASLALLTATAVLLCAVMLLRELRFALGMRRARLLVVWARNPYNLVGVLTPLVVGATLASGYLTRAKLMDGWTTTTTSYAAAASALLVVMRLLSWIRHWSQQFAMFVACLGMIIKDLASFLVVLFVVLVGFAWAFFMLSAELVAGGAHGAASNASSLLLTNASSAEAPELLAAFSPALLGAYSAGLLGQLSASKFLEAGAVVGPLILAFTFLVVLVMLNVLIAVVSDSYEAAMVRALRVYHRTRVELAVQAELAPQVWRPPDSLVRFLGVIPLRTPIVSFLLFNLPLYVLIGVADGVGGACFHFALLFQYARVALVLHYMFSKGEGLTIIIPDSKQHYLLRHLWCAPQHSSVLEEESDDSWLGRVLDLDRRVHRAVDPVGGKVDELSVVVNEIAELLRHTSKRENGPARSLIR